MGNNTYSTDGKKHTYHLSFLDYKYSPFINYESIRT